MILPEAVPLKKLFGKKILMVEDSPDGKELIHLYFRSTGAQLVFAENGYEAISAAWREKPNFLILMDVQMPGLDGLEAGCNYNPTKPVMKDALLSLVGELLQHSPPAPLHH